MHVIVIGAGPSGLAASLGLSSLGCTVDLLEKHAGFDVRGSTLGLAVNGAKALQEICPNEDVSTLTDMGIPLPTTGGSMLAWWNIRDWLLDRVRKDTNITLRMGMTLISIHDESDSAIVHCNEGDFTGDLIVGADGVGSQVRSLLGLAPNQKTGYQIWRGSADADGDPILEPVLEEGVSPFGMQIWNTNTSASIFNHHPKLPKRLNWVVSSCDPSIQSGTTTPLDLAKPHMDKKMVPIFTRLWEKSAEHELTNSYAMRTTALPADGGSGWGGRGRVTLIGDAAHAIRPASGQGTAMAFEDCAVLCRKIKISDGNKDMERLILDFENERLERLRVISDHERRRAESVYSGKPLKPWPKEYEEWVFAGV